MSIIKIPEAFEALLKEKHRYFVYYGGRAAGKTYSIATALIIQALQKNIKVLCCRETMQSIKNSVYEVLILRIRQMGLEDFFTIKRDSIVADRGEKPTNSVFMFTGLYRNIDQIKSIPEISVAWVNEAAALSEESLQLLIPTIREEGSYLIFEFNPDYEDDPVYKKFIIDSPPDAYVRKVSWRDNPYLTHTIRDEMADDFARKPAEAAHIWEGELKRYGQQVWSPPFEHHIHIKDFDIPSIKDYKVFQALDPHTSFYSAAIWAMRWKKDNGSYITWVFREWPTFSRVNANYTEIRNKLHWNGTVKDLATEFYAAEAGLVNITQRYIDTRFAKGYGGIQANLINNTESLVDRFAKAENGGMLYQMPQEQNIDGAKDMIRKALQYNTLTPISPLNEPLLYVSPNCRNVIRALTNHRYEESNEREVETYKDFSDCLKIMFAGLSEYKWPVKPKSRDMGVWNLDTGWMGA